MKFQYKTAAFVSDTINYDSFIFWLNGRGEEGWELVHMKVVPPNEVVCIFKRRK